MRRELRNSAHALTTSAGNRVHEAPSMTPRKSVKKVPGSRGIFETSGCEAAAQGSQACEVGPGHSRGSATAPRSSTRSIGFVAATPGQLPEPTYEILRRGLVAARDRREARARRDGVVAEAAERLEKTRKSARRVDIPVNHMARRDRDRHRLLSSESSRDETGARDGAVGDAAPLAQRGQNPLVSAAPGKTADDRRRSRSLPNSSDWKQHWVTTTISSFLGATLRGCRGFCNRCARTCRQVERLAARMPQPLRRRAFALGRRLHVRKPAAFARWLRASFKRARASADCGVNSFAPL